MSVAAPDSLGIATAGAVDGLSGAPGAQAAGSRPHAETGAAQRARQRALRNVRVMFSAARAAPLTRSGPRPLPIARFSAGPCGHPAPWWFSARAPNASRRSRSLYDQMIKPHEHQLVWYSFRQKLPEVSPPEMQIRSPPGAEMKSLDQTIVSNPKQGERGAQMIWRPAPQMKPQPQVVSPNILAFRLPLIPAPPPGPPGRLFVPPERQRQKTLNPGSLPEPPKVQTQSRSASDAG